MPVERKFEVVPDDSPLRCQAVHFKGQCKYRRCEHSTFCPMHNGGIGDKAHAEESLNMLRLAKWQGRVGDLAEHEKVKSLREEIGVLRMMLEETINRCGDQVELIMNSGKIADLIMKIEKLVVSCHKLESNLGMLLDKQAAMQLSGEIVDIIGRYVSDEAAIGRIADDIAAALARVGSSTKKDS